MRASVSRATHRTKTAARTPTAADQRFMLRLRDVRQDGRASDRTDDLEKPCARRTPEATIGRKFSSPPPAAGTGGAAGSGWRYLIRRLRLSNRRPPVLPVPPLPEFRVGRVVPGDVDGAPEDVEHAPVLGALQ